MDILGSVTKLVPHRENGTRAKTSCGTRITRQKQLAARPAPACKAACVVLGFETSVLSGFTTAAPRDVLWRWFATHQRLASILPGSIEPSNGLEDLVCSWRRCGGGGSLSKVCRMMMLAKVQRLALTRLFGSRCCCHRRCLPLIVGRTFALLSLV